MRQNLIGQVIGTAMQKTAKVRVARTKLVKKLDVVMSFFALELSISPYR